MIDAHVYIQIYIVTKIVFVKVEACCFVLFGWFWNNSSKIYKSFVATDIEIYNTNNKHDNPAALTVLC